ncbi:MAG: hypothetical protein RL603_1318 [Pseudomonadota bacterium]|jgi:YidC/Oxa1 family membrane protein insertase
MFLWLGLVLALWLNYETWQRDYAVAEPAASAAATKTQTAENSALATEVPSGLPAPAAATPPTANAPTPPPALSGDLPAVPSVAAPVAAPTSDAPAAPTPAVTAPPRVIRIATDVLDLEVSEQGADLIGAELSKYPLVKGEAKPVHLFNRAPNEFYHLQTGLAGTAGVAAPTHLARYSSAAAEYRLAPDAQELRVPFTWTDAASGVTVTKTFVLRRGQYRIDLEYAVDNRGTSPWTVSSYAQILRDDKPVERSMFSVESYAFKGPAYYNGTKYFKIDRQKVADAELPREVTGGWIAGMQHHFVTAVVPAEGRAYRYSLKTQGDQYLLAVSGPAQTIAPQSGVNFAETLFVGPKLQAQLKTTGPRLDLVADYGRLTILAEPLFWLLEQAHKMVGNWGWAIILITMLLKLVFYPLSESSGKSMAKMRLLAPRIKNLQDTYKDDREKLGRAMMDLYKREKVNPLAGCLPILIQMPVFFAFYWVLLESVEMRQTPFMFWIQDLSSKDPFFVLPLVMAGAMFVQYKLNPAPPDPIQAKVFMIMPIFMSATFAFFPAGLVLYWVTNTLLSIAQQWNINRRIEAGAKKAHSG